MLLVAVWSLGLFKGPLSAVTMCIYDTDHKALSLRLETEYVARTSVLRQRDEVAFRN